MMGLGGGELNLPAMLLNQESQRIVNDGRQQDQKKQQQEMDQNQQTMQKLQQMQAVEQARRTPVNQEQVNIQAIQKEKQQSVNELNTWKQKLEEAEQQRNLLSAMPGSLAKDLAERALNDAKFARQEYKDLLTEQVNKEKQTKKDIGSIAQVTADSPNNYIQNLTELAKHDPEFVKGLLQKYGPVFSAGAKEALENKAKMSLDENQLLSRKEAAARIEESIRHHKDMERQANEQAADRRQREATRREERLEKVKTTKDAADITNIRYEKAEAKAKDNLVKEIGSLKKDFEKVKILQTKELDPKKKQEYEEQLMAISEAGLEANDRHNEAVNKARADAIFTYKGTDVDKLLPRIKETYSSLRHVAPSGLDATHKTVSGEPASALIAKTRAETKASGDKNEYTDAQILKFLQDNGAMSKPSESAKEAVTSTKEQPSEVAKQTLPIGKKTLGDFHREVDTWIEGQASKISNPELELVANVIGKSALPIGELFAGGTVFKALGKGMSMLKTTKSDVEAIKASATLREPAEVAKELAAKKGKEFSELLPAQRYAKVRADREATEAVYDEHLAVTHATKEYFNKADEVKDAIATARNIATDTQRGWIKQAEETLIARNKKMAADQKKLSEITKAYEQKGQLSKAEKEDAFAALERMAANRKALEEQAAQLQRKF